MRVERVAEEETCKSILCKKIYWKSKVLSLWFFFFLIIPFLSTCCLCQAFPPIIISAPSSKEVFENRTTTSTGKWIKKMWCIHTHTHTHTHTYIYTHTYNGCCIVQLLSRVWLFATPRTAACQPGFPVLHYLPEFAQILVYWVIDGIQPSHPLSPPSPLALSLS